MTRGHSQMGTEQIHPLETSYWPVVLAVGLAVAMVGLMTTLAIAVVGGIICIVAMLAWTVERFHGPAGPVSPEKPEVPSLGEGAGEAEVELPVEMPRSPQWWGLVWFIATEAVFFTNLIGGYLYLRASSASWPPAGTPHVELGFPIVNTIILLASGIPAWYAHTSIKRGDQRGLRIGLSVAAAMGAIFLAGQLYEYSLLGLALQDSIFATGFYVLTGFHGLHVVAGIALLLVVLALSRRGRFTAERNFAVDVASTYWHFVDVVWVFLFTLLYLIR